MLTAKLLVVFASTVILGSTPHRTRDHILQSDDSGSLQTTHYVNYAEDTTSSSYSIPVCIFLALICVYRTVT
jgi:hypothetical protein